MARSLWVLGLDGGGSHTVCLVVDGEGRQAARSVSGPCNHQSVGVPAAQAALTAAILAARQEAGDPTLAAACLGMAGFDREEDLYLIAGMAAPLLPGVQLEIVHDADIALAAGGGGRRPGVVVVAGTGSIAVGYDAAGRRARAGGWGHLLGDEGSGYDIARKGLSAATRAYDGRAEGTILIERLPMAAETPTLEKLANRIYLENWTVGQVAALAPVVLAAAEAGDPAALEILEAAAGQLAQAARVVIAGLRLQEQAFPVVLSGGLFTSHTRLFELVREAILDFAPQACVSLPRHEPAYGAALLALEAARRVGASSDLEQHPDPL